MTLPSAAPRTALDDQPLLHFSRVGKSYRDGSREVWPLREVSFTLRAGEVGLLLGPSGSGKSTLLLLAGGVARPTEGEVELLGRSLARLPEELRTTYRRQHVGIVFQQFQLLEEERVLENVILPLLPQGVPRRVAQERARRILAELGLAALTQARAGLLSGGEMQRVALARALIADPALLLLDEPTSQLDTVTATSLLGELARLRGRGRGLLIASHDPRLVERLRPDQTYDLRDGVLTLLDGPGPA
ncbi:MAG: ABC transporter ATP-binding protein [Myxococcota bacterium]|jgi:ABC-type lipoprotein export system ATPase subunit|nr:ABC transporter ATP-binding protein [Myxococcota bacterium]